MVELEDDTLSLQDSSGEVVRGSWGGDKQDRRKPSPVKRIPGSSSQHLHSDSVVLMADHDTSDQSPSHATTKRARQACENCRRKKSKCSGEQPDCSFCVRLHQKCVYVRHRRMRSGRGRGGRDRDEPMRDNVVVPPAMADALLNSDRLREIEGKLEQLAAAIESTRHGTADGPFIQGPTDSESARSHPSWAPNVPPSPKSLLGGTAGPSGHAALADTTERGKEPGARMNQELQLPEAVVEEGIALFYANYCNQPCPIAARYKKSEMPPECIPTIVLAPMLALSLRSSRHSLLVSETGKRQQLETLTQQSWDLLAKAYSEFDIDDAYFEGSCLLALVHYGEGKPERAHAQISLALRIAQSRRMLSSKSFNSLAPALRPRRQEIIWTLFMLDRMLLDGSIRDPSVTAASFELPSSFDGPLRPDPMSSPDTYLGAEIPQPLHSIVQLNLEILTIWEAVLGDITQPASNDEIPIWRHDSRRAAVLTKLMDFETRCHKGHHGYVSTGPATRVLEEPHVREYFLAWIFYQLVHCIIQCCLNHPFIIYVKTLRIKEQVPVTFLQKSYEYSMIHANWVFRLLNEMDDANLTIHDPFIVRLVAIAASIHLEHTLSQHPTVARSAKQKFETCLHYVERISEEWPSLLVTASLLKELQSRLVYRPNMNYVEDEYDGAARPSSPRQEFLSEEDTQLMWKLFDLPTQPRGGLEGDILESDQMQDVADMGSYGQKGDSEQDSAIQFLGRVEDSQSSNVRAGTLSGLGSPETSAQDWSLFGRLWADYMPGDFASIDSMNMGSTYQW